MKDLSSKGLQKIYISAEANSINTRIANKTSNILDTGTESGVDNNIDVMDMSNMSS